MAPKASLCHGRFHVNNAQKYSVSLLPLVDCKFFKETGCVLSVPEFLACGTGLPCGKQVTNLAQGLNTCFLSKLWFTV